MLKHTFNPFLSRPTPRNFVTLFEHNPYTVRLVLSIAATVPKHSLHQVWIRPHFHDHPLQHLHLCMEAVVPVLGSLLESHVLLLQGVDYDSGFDVLGFELRECIFECLETAMNFSEGSRLGGWIGGRWTAMTQWCQVCVVRLALGCGFWDSIGAAAARAAWSLGLG